MNVRQRSHRRLTGLNAWGRRKDEREFTVLPEPQPSPPSEAAHALLYLNGTCVGSVSIQGWDASWTYGMFQPNDAFSAFAPVFGRWSMLMHEDPDEPLSEAASIELRRTEQEIDALHAAAHFPAEDAWQPLAQLNLDGELIEWKTVAT